MSLYVSSMTLSGMTLEGENPLPCFSHPVRNRPLTHDGTFRPEEEPGFGEQIGKRVLPYSIQDRYSRQKSPVTVKTIVMENENLKAVFLPEYGARLYSLLDKRSGKELLHRNDALVFGNLSQRNAWFSGGIELNFGRYGHCTLTCAPMFAAEVKGPDYNFLRFYEYERVTSSFSQMDFHLPDGAQTLNMFVRITASDARDMPLYCWTNAAVPQTNDCRIFSGTDRVLFTLPRRADAPDSIPCMSAGHMPKIKVFNGDCSYPAQIGFSCEYFFQNPLDKQPWQAVYYEDGRMFFETSTLSLRYRKMFCWGNHAGGRNWHRFLNTPNNSEYVEIQAGPSPSQLHGAILPAGQSFEFTQCYGECVPQANLLEMEWHDAAAAAESAVCSLVSQETLELLHERYGECAALPVRVLYGLGSGWGALECARLMKNGGKLPKGLTFPAASMDAEQLPWLSLLESGILPEHEPPRRAGWLTGEAWLTILDRAVKQQGGEHWESLLHLGIMLMEAGDAEKAREAWEKSVGLIPSAEAFRNLSQYYVRAGDGKRALSFMQKALALPDSEDAAYCEEYLSLLIINGMYKEAWDYFHALNPIQRSERCEITLCHAALKLGEDNYLEDFFAKEHPVIQEGELEITDIWNEWQSETGRKLPENLDFRMYVKEIL